eukprot:Hpha_TRINITY_DN24791_c0_g1::TRINITY_DN24791_c0_g1_i1::g.110267::m.110267
MPNGRPSSGSNASREERKFNMDKLASETRKFGTTCGFRYFHCYLRGKEELVVNVRGSPSHPIADSVRFVAVEHGHAPASPASKRVEGKPDEVPYLVSAYARYERPMGWCRVMSPHFSFAFETHQGWSSVGNWHKQGKSEYDAPLVTKSFVEWPQRAREIGLKDFVCDLVNQTLSPPPENPLEVAFETLAITRGPADPRALAEVAALMQQLQQVRNPSPGVLADLDKLYGLYAEHTQRLLGATAG